MEQEKLQYRQEDEIEIDLKEIFWILKKKLWLIILVAIIGMGITGSYSYFMIKPTYSSTSLIYIDSGSSSLSGKISSLADLQIGEALTADYSVIIKSRPVLEEVITNLGLNTTYKQLSNLISVSSPSDTRMLRITVTAGDPQTAARIVNELDEVCIWRIQELVSSVVPQIVEEGVEEPNKVSPSNTKNALLGGFAGAFIIIAIYVLKMIFNDTIKTDEDIEKYIGLPVLSEIPLERGGRSVKKKHRRK